MKSPTMHLEDELRKVLRGQKAPEALRQRLLAEARRHEPRRIPAWILSAAAALLLCVAGLGLWRNFIMDPAPELAQLAYAEYQSTQRLDFQGEPPAQGENCCAQWSKRNLGFSAPMPSCVPSCCIQGGRACKLARKPVAFYQLDANRALYVFPEPIRKQTEAPGREVSLPTAVHAHLWNEGGRGYLLLENTAR